MPETPEIWDEVVYRSAGRNPLGHVSARGHLHASHGLKTYRVLQCYSLVYILTGEGYYKTPGERERSVGSGDVILVFPGIPHRYGPLAPEGWSEIYLLFAGKIFDAWRETGVVVPDEPILRATPVEKWARKFGEILSPAPASRIPSSASLQAVCRVQSLLADILASKTSGVSDGNDAWLEQAYALLEAVPYRGLGAIARQLGSNRESFRKRFRRLAGISATRHRTACLIDRACALIQQGGMRDAEIADALGFSDPAHFSRRFKEHMKQTPTAFRANLPRNPS